MIFEYDTKQFEDRAGYFQYELSSCPDYLACHIETTSAEC
jgi:hypothetical protein